MLATITITITSATVPKDLSALCDFLGFDKQGDQVRLNPRVPGDWEECTILYRYGGSRYQLTAARDAPFVTLDGAQTGAPSITLIDDGRAHEARFPLN